MDIFEYAMQMEKDGENFYRQVARQSPNRGIKAILTMLADEEVRHYKAIEKMKSAEPVQLADTTILTDAKNVFARLKESGETFTSETNQTSLYKKALDIEAESRDFYTEKAGEASEQNAKKLFLRLAHEEQKHYVLVENIMDFLSRPDTWLENAEFYHLDEY
jgi:rubrerythrin